jgi:hypothetical protein
LILLLFKSPFRSHNFCPILFHSKISPQELSISRPKFIWIYIYIYIFFFYVWSMGNDVLQNIRRLFIYILYMRTWSIEGSRFTCKFLVKVANWMLLALHSHHGKKRATLFRTAREMKCSIESWNEVAKVSEQFRSRA